MKISPVREIVFYIYLGQAFDNKDIERGRIGCLGRISESIWGLQVYWFM